MFIYWHVSWIISKIGGKIAWSAVGKKWCGVWIFNPTVNAYDKNPFNPTSVSFDALIVCSPKSSIFSAPSVHIYWSLCPQNNTLPNMSPNNPYIVKYNFTDSIKLPVDKYNNTKTIIGTPNHKSGLFCFNNGTITIFNIILTGCKKKYKTCKTG